MAKKTAKTDFKTVPCTFCGKPIQVSHQTMSIFCPHCHKRVVCEDYCIKNYHAVRMMATCGNVVVERKGHVVAPIQANALTVRGLVKGDVKVQSVVEVEATGTIQGNVEAPRLVLHDGGRVIGICKIVGNSRSKADTVDVPSVPPHSVAASPPPRAAPKPPTAGLSTRSQRLALAPTPPGRSAACEPHTASSEVLGPTIHTC